MDTLQLTLILFIHLLVLNLLNRRVAVLYLSRALPKTNHRLSDELPFGQGKDRSSICFIICVHCDLSLSLQIFNIQSFIFLHASLAQI